MNDATPSRTPFAPQRPTREAFPAPSPRAPRLLVVPGLHDSGAAHWQTWLQRQSRGSRRVVQADWTTPDLEAWARRIETTLVEAGPGPWLVAAHSFGVLALAHLLGERPPADDGAGRPLGLAGALLVAPADPDKFGVTHRLPHRPLPLSTTVVASDTDPWMSGARALEWARRWHSGYLNLGDAGHINAESGFGPLPLAQRWLRTMQQRLSAEWRGEG